ncbi:MAG: CRISPR-associated endoribonuclease Cas6 [Bacillota bacterium]
MPIHYNYTVQGAIYNSIDKELAAFLHDQGFTVGSRNFKMFSFSRLNGSFRIQDKSNTITFADEVRLVISSPINDFCQSLVNILLTRGFVLFGENRVKVKKVYLKKMEVSGEKVVVKTLSPIVLYSTLLRPDGRKYTCYFQPGDPDYEHLLAENLRKKYQAIYGKDAPWGDVKVKSIGRPKLAVIKYKDFIIKGYSGKLELRGPQELLQIGVDSGLGSKNSQGFGCVEIEEVKQKE